MPAFPYVYMIRRRLFSSCLVGRAVANVLYNVTIGLPIINPQGRRQKIMITSVFSILLNWILLYSLLAFGLVLYGKPLQGWRPEIAAALLASMSLGTLLLLGLTPMAEWLLRHSYDCDKCTPEEAAYLQPLFAEVCLRAGQDPSLYRLFVCPKEDENALALGSKSVAITTGLLKTATPAELQGVLAHELGHHLLHHTFWLTLTCVSGQVGSWTLRLYSLILMGISFLRAVPLLGYVIWILLWSFRLLFILFDWFVQLPFFLGMLFGSRRNEYAADRFAARIGCGSGLRSFLERVLTPQEAREGFFQRLKRTHPASSKRARRLAHLGA